MGSQDLKKPKVTIIICLLLFDQFKKQLPKLRASILGNQRLLTNDLVDGHLHVGVGREVEEIERLSSQLRILLVLKNDTLIRCSAQQ
jgi:hypothetical protein